MKTAMTAALIVVLISLSSGAQAARFERNTSVADQPVVKDSATGLLWQGCAGGLTGDACATGTPAEYAWKDALAYCEGLSWGGNTDWRLPNKKELFSIVDGSRYDPSIDITAFPGTTSHYWSSSSFARNEGFAWFVNFHSGGLVSPNAYSKTYAYQARCVRGGP